MCIADENGRCTRLSIDLVSWASHAGFFRTKPPEVNAPLSQSSSPHSAQTADHCRRNRQLCNMWRCSSASEKAQLPESCLTSADYISRRKVTRFREFPVPSDN